MQSVTHPGLEVSQLNVSCFVARFFLVHYSVVKQSAAENQYFGRMGFIVHSNNA